MCGFPAWARLHTQPLHEHMDSHGTLTAVPQLRVSLSPLASWAQPAPSLCQNTGVLTGNLPGPQSHSQTPAASKLRLPLIPVSIHAFPLEYHGSFLSWPDMPAAGSHRQSQDSLLRAPPLLLEMFIIKELGTPRGQMLPTLANHLALTRRGAQEPGSQFEEAREPGRLLCGSGQAVELSLLDTQLGTLSYCPLD